ncbi:hypothetical protein [uncultured Brevundimonas sp.]|uniref:hypothetical protein n=1 Tax=uncultured Brevundimonas sp. TaxID=213418 RepID=UPI002600F90C|nr:hypothetical protein [uncultured Brevundimonas sp.]
MTATQAPTPGPMSADGVKMLVKGDLLLCKTWGVVRLDRFDDSGVRAFVLDLANDQVRLMKPINMAFIGRPGPDGWMPWSGGENPVPRRMVEVKIRWRDGVASEWPVESDVMRWKHRRGRDGGGDIIAFRLAPTAPVEASGSERDRIAKVLRERVQIGGTDWDKSAYGADMNAEEVADAILALRPQPSGETRALLERIAAVRARKDFTPQQANAGLLTVLDDCAAALSTTPARAEAQDEQPDITPYTEDLKGLKAAMQSEAQDEGAAGEREAIVEAVKVAMKDAWEDHASDTGCWPADIKRVSDRGPLRLMFVPAIWAQTTAEWAAETILRNRAHPSPTPAADADRVREAFDAGVDVGYRDITGRDAPQAFKDKKWPEAIAALKSTAAKEGGE